MTQMKVMLDPYAKMPTKSHEDDAGWDIYSPEDVIVPPWSNKAVNTGVHIQLPKNTVGLIKSRSGMNVMWNITSEGVIDAGYHGQIIVNLRNHSNAPYIVHAEDRISQLVIVPLENVELEQVASFDTKTERESNGIGSTGK